MEPLSGIRVIALEHYFAGPFGSQFLADAGAEVIKIEPPGVGETSRVMGRIHHRGGDVPMNFLRLNRNKRSVELDIKTEAGKQVLWRLAEQSDVFWENLGPGTVNRLGFGPDEVLARLPRMVYASISGFGKSAELAGPYRDRPAFDFITQAMSGLMWLPSSGAKPEWLGFQLTDLYPGVLAAFGVVMALRRRDATGDGDHVDISMYDAAVNLNEKVAALYSLTGTTPSGPGDLQMTNQLGVFTAKDGYVAVGVVSDASWPQLCAIIGRPELAEDPRIGTANQRTAALGTVVRPAIAAWASDQPRDSIVENLAQIHVPVGPVQSMDEVLACPHLRARGMFTTYSTDELGEFGLQEDFVAVDNPIKMINALKRDHRPPPRLGVDTGAVLREIAGMTTAEIDHLAETGTIGRSERPGDLDGTSRFSERDRKFS